MLWLGGSATAVGVIAGDLSEMDVLLGDAGDGGLTTAGF